MLIWNHRNGCLVIKTKADFEEYSNPDYEPSYIRIPPRLEPFDTSTTDFSDEQILSEDFYAFKRKGHLSFQI